MSQLAAKGLVEKMELSDGQSRQVSDIAAEYGLHMILVFGSALTGRSHPGSDLDIAVGFKGRAPNLRRYAELCHRIQTVFPNQTVDVSVLNLADPLFLGKITENCELLYGETRHLQELKMYAFKRFQDHRPYFEMERTYVQRFLNEMVPKQ